MSQLLLISRKRAAFSNLSGMDATRLRAVTVALEGWRSAQTAWHRLGRSPQSLLGAPVFNRLWRVPPDSRTSQLLSNPPHSGPRLQGRSPIADKSSALPAPLQTTCSFLTSRCTTPALKGLRNIAQGQPSLSEATLGADANDREANPSPRHIQHQPAASATLSATHWFRVQTALQCHPLPPYDDTLDRVPFLSGVPFLRLFEFFAAIQNPALPS
jgi:hypothetical protein